MSRYIVVQGLAQIYSSTQGTVANWFVVDTTSAVIVADCGDSQSRANAIAAALNASI